MNDDFADAEDLGTSTTGTVSWSNVDATVEVDEPVAEANDNHVTVWGVLTPDTAGWLTVDTHGSAIDTVLSVWTGTDFTDLVEVASNDDDPDAEDYTSLVLFEAEADVPLFIKVGGYDDSEQGDITVSWAPGEEPPPPPPPSSPANFFYTGAVQHFTVPRF